MPQSNNYFCSFGRSFPVCPLRPAFGAILVEFDLIWHFIDGTIYARARCAFLSGSIWHLSSAHFQCLRNEDRAYAEIAAMSIEAPIDSQASALADWIGRHPLVENPIDFSYAHDPFPSDWSSRPSHWSRPPSRYTVHSWMVDSD